MRGLQQHAREPAHQVISVNMDSGKIARIIRAARMLTNNEHGY
jgi:hypothetical protein